MPGTLLPRTVGNSADRTAWPCLLLLGGLGALHAVWLVGATLGSVDSPFWRAPPNDIAIGLIGMEAFLQDGWHWPLGLTERLLASGEPISIAYTDSLPLLAILLKALGITASMLPPFGLAILIGQILQPIAAGWALRRAGLSRWAILLPGALLLALAPYWSYRLLLQHVALTWHWEILLALGLALGWCRTGRLPRGEVAGAIALSAAATGTHAYLAVQVIAILLSGCFVLLRAGRPLAFGMFGLAIVGGAVAGAIAVGLWPPPKAGLAIGPYTAKPGFLSSNLFGPLDFSSSALWTASQPIDATGGQYEGMSYVGAGVLLLVVLLAAAAVVRRLPMPLRLSLRSPDVGQVPAIGRFWPLMVVTISLALVAVFPTVWLGHTKLISLPVPTVLSPFFEQFRSNGRFVWPALYLLVILVMIAAVRGSGLRLASAAIAVALALQLADGAILRHGMRDMIARAGTAIPDELPTLSAAGALEGDVRLRPSWACVRFPDFALGRLISLNVIRAGGIVHQPPMARGATSDCNPSVIAGDQAIPGVTDFIFRYSLPFANQVALIRRRDCTVVESLFACHGERPAGALAVEQALLLLSPDNTVQCGVRYPIALGHPGQDWLLAGWSGGETWGTWNDGPLATLMLPVPAQGSVRALRLEMTAFSAAPAQRQPLSVASGGRTLWEGELVASQIRSIRISGDAELLRAGVVLLNLHVGNPQSPASAGMSSDTRLLGVGLVSVEWECGR